MTYRRNKDYRTSLTMSFSADQIVRGSLYHAAHRACFVMGYPNFCYEGEHYEVVSKQKLTNGYKLVMKVGKRSKSSEPLLYLDRQKLRTQGIDL